MFVEKFVKKQKKVAFSFDDSEERYKFANFE
jgi:hypothetical protein